METVLRLMFHHSLIPIFHSSDTLSHMYQYQQRNQYFAQIAAGFEDIAEAELKELGAKAVQPAFRGLHFQADAAALYRINYTSRLLVRVLAPLVTFDCHSDRYLHQTAFKIDWSQFITPH
ncbi:MAG: hypothetical protein AB7E95_03320, partial [Kiritimatiellales bacterium]